MALTCEFTAPQDPKRRNALRNYTPPQSVRIIHEGRLHWPFVYDVIRHKNPETLQVTYQQDKSRHLGLRFLVKGDAYALWQLIPADRHLFGVEGGARLYLLGADRLVGVALSLVLGITIGGISGYYSGWTDNLIQRGIELLQSFPTIPLWLALSAAMPADWSQIRVYFCMTLILALLGWTGVARVVRGKILALREEEYAVAAKLAGVGEMKIILRHLIPGFMSHLIVVVTIAIPQMILAETSLSFLRLGLRAPTISWGVLLQDAQNINALGLYPWLLYPAAFVIVAVLMFNFLGDGLRDAADPYK